MVDENVTGTKDCWLYANMLIEHSFTNLGASPPKRIKICEPSPIHTSDDTRDLGRHPARQPPQNESKRFANPYPYTWSKNPYSYSYSGKDLFVEDCQIFYRFSRSVYTWILPFSIHGGLFFSKIAWILSRTVSISSFANLFSHTSFAKRGGFCFQCFL